MTTLDQVRALFTEGALIECVENTYRPEISGTRRRITRVGRSFCVCDLLENDKVTEEGFWKTYPKLARDVLHVDEQSVKYRLGRGEHTVELKVIG